MKHNNPKLIPLLIICACFLSAVLAQCDYGRTTMSVRIVTEFFERSVAKDSKHLKTISSSKNFKKQHEKLGISGSISAGFGGFSASAKASYEAVKDSASSGESYKELIKTDIVEFHPNENQIIRRITTTISINGVTATERDEVIVDAQPKDQELSLAELRQKANEYMTYRFGNNVINNVYQETTTTCNQKYRLTDRGQTCQDIGLLTITTEKECQKAMICQFDALYLSKTTSSISPKGCHLIHDLVMINGFLELDGLTPSNKGYFNEHATGARGQYAQEICISK